MVLRYKIQSCHVFLDCHWFTNGIKTIHCQKLNAQRKMLIIGSQSELEGQQFAVQLNGQHKKLASGYL